MTHMIHFISPGVTVRKDDLVREVDEALQSAGTVTFAVSEEEYHALGALLAPATLKFGAFWQTYEEDWIEPGPDLTGFHRAVEDLTRSQIDGPLVQTLRGISTVTRACLERNAPLVIRS